MARWTGSRISRRKYRGSRLVQAHQRACLADLEWLWVSLAFAGQVHASRMYIGEELGSSEEGDLGVRWEWTVKDEDGG